MANFIKCTSYDNETTLVLDLDQVASVESTVDEGGVFTSIILTNGEHVDVSGISADDLFVDV